MPRLYTYLDTTIDTPARLQRALDELRSDEIVTPTQMQTLNLALQPLLPCRVRLGVRTPLCIVYVQAGDRMFRVGQRGQFTPGAWRAHMKTKNFW
jgi:hypothetical protein